MKLTQEQAIKFGENGLWESMTYRQRAEFQLSQQFLSMPFGEFHKAVEESIGRPVWTHEFVNPEGLLAELRGELPAPTFEEILEMIPEEKRILVFGN